MLPTSAFFVIRRKDMYDEILFVRDAETGKWTLPGSVRKKRFKSYMGFARDVLGSIFDGLSVVSIKLVVAIKGKMFIGIRRTRCAVFECEVAGVERPDSKANWCYMTPENVPAAILSPDVASIVPMLVRVMEGSMHESRQT